MVSRICFRSNIQAHKDIGPLDQRVLHAVRTKGTVGIQRELEALTPQDLKNLLDKIVLELKDKDLDRLASIITLEKLQETIKIQYPEHVDILHAAKDMLQEAKYLLATTESKVSPTLKTRLTSILNALISVLETFLDAFGIADFFKPSESSFAADMKGQKIMSLISLFMMMSGVLIPLLGAEMGAMIIGGTLLSLAALSLIYPFFKPQASMLPRGKNWTAQLQRGDLFATDGRKETLDTIAHTLISGQGQVKTHAMLLGKTGIGKTATAKAFVQAVERGDYPELKGKQIFYFNTADLLGGPDVFSRANKIFAKISETMGRHRNNFILIFDEIHIVCQDREQEVLSEQLKTFLDAGKDNFPYLIGITTEEEYYREIYAKNAAFARRFQRIVIDNTDDVETVKILKSALLKQSPATILDQDVLQKILEKTKDAFGAIAAQPATSLKILSQCVNRTALSQRSPLEIKVEALRNRIQAQQAHYAGSLPYNREVNPLEENSAAELEEELVPLEASLNTAKDQLKALFQNRDRLLEIKKEALKKVVTAEHYRDNALSNKNKEHLKTFALQSHFQTRLLEAKIRRDAAALNVNIAITPELIDEVIKEEVDNAKKAQEAVMRGQAQLAARAAVPEVLAEESDTELSSEGVITPTERSARPSQPIEALTELFL